ncbi:CAP domain-containing protein [Rhodoplanes sp. TEM]|uniref:CAP domain-containing protein n=1 Tax=Rhodoplanes tepidamans TaxID=200616 RepID=A0ABT5J5Y1_RHOTP|nr:MULTISPECIES: CAP domain-containing protein [Rhodoplanes]MDC7784923.1 CAP domain-containing protein [Rhodoplanes tepidamans]MDC7983981.1 CAP domain-containing protein [Rhodoplanes sp. TEM]MDQ0353848.1 uncharacterized protein YkwD [Rhodoplanes tepidamans]
MPQDVEMQEGPTRRDRPLHRPAGSGRRPPAVLFARPAWRAALAALLIAASALGSPATAESPRPDDLEALRAAALDAVNRDRRRHDLPALSPEPAAEAAAQAHAADMLARDYFAHRSPEGGTVADRHQEAGGSRWRLTAENIARCEACTPPADRDRVERLQEGWMNSPEHRANILRRGLSGFGFGLAASRSGGLYAVQAFAGPGTPRGLSSGETASAIPPDAQVRQALDRVNAARREAGHRPLDASPALTEAAASLLPASDARDFALGDRIDLFGHLPAGARRSWASLGMLAAVCGGCGTRPTDADVAFFTGQWLDAKGRDRMMDPDATHLGFAVAANGDGKKIGLALLGTAR